MQYLPISPRRFRCLAWTLISIWIGSTLPGWLPQVAIGDQLTFTQEGVRREIQGAILVEAVDGGVLFRDEASRLWLVQPDEIEKKVDDDTDPKLGKKELGEALIEELGEGFRVEDTDHWVIAYDTERAYARYIGGLYERLFRGFTGHWKSKRKWKLDEPDAPFVALVFKTYDEYAQYVRKDLGIEAPQTMVAYYNLMTNRVVMYDLTSSLAAGHAALQDDRQVHEILSNPNALAMVATVVHEGTHQLMFNLGMQQRLASTPLWVNEGLAMYFETPDMRSMQGWRAIGLVNVTRLAGFRQSLGSSVREPNALEQLLSDDESFRDPAQMLDRYAEAWAFNYFLLMKHDREYVEYLKFLSEKKPLREDDAQTRIGDFQQFFKEDLAELDQEFVEYIRKLN
jgi:hypothetical protein